MAHFYLVSFFAEDFFVEDFFVDGFALGGCWNSFVLEGSALEGFAGVEVEVEVVDDLHSARESAVEVLENSAVETFAHDPSTSALET